MSSSLRVIVESDGDTAMAKTEEFLFLIGAVIRRRKHRTILADVTHPDGFDCNVSVKFYVGEDDDNVLEVRRRAGDAVLFYVFFDRLSLWNCGKGQMKKLFYDGQICPRVVVGPQPTPMRVPVISLDQYGTKRKYEHPCDSSESSE